MSCSQRSETNTETSGGSGCSPCWSRLHCFLGWRPVCLRCWLAGTEVRPFGLSGEQSFHDQKRTFPHGRALRGVWLGYLKNAATAGAVAAFRKRFSAVSQVKRSKIRTIFNFSKWSQGQWSICISKCYSSSIFKFGAFVLILEVSSRLFLLYF